MCMNIDLSSYSVCFSVSARRQSIQRRLFRAAGLALPSMVAPLRVELPTRKGEPKAYSALALNFVETLVAAHKAELPYLVIFEDDASPCPNPQAALNALLAEHPLPSDCGLLALGDINGVSCVRGKETLLLNACAPVFTPLVPGRAENKGSHALVVFHSAMIPYAQAIMENGVTDLAISRIGRYSLCPLRAYGLFHHPLFLQHRYDQRDFSRFPYRTPELFVGRPDELIQAFPLCHKLTTLKVKGEVKRFFVFSNAPGKNVQNLGLGDGDVAVLLNRAVDFSALGSMRKLLICRRNAAQSNNEWFTPQGQADRLGQLYEDFLLPTDAELEAERPWFVDYKAATEKLPTTGWVAWRLLQDDFPDAEVILVDFNPAGDIGTYKWPKHDWWGEAEDYKLNGAKVIFTRCGF